MPDILHFISSPRRKRIALRLTENNLIEVLCPPKTDEAAVRKFIAENPSIISRLHRKYPVKKTPEFHEGNCFMLLGKPYPLHLTCRLRIFDNAFMLPRGTNRKIQQAMISLYKELAGTIIRQRITLWQGKCGVSPLKIRISSANTRWGSCSADKTVSFSWKLIQCPLESVDYVIVHELSHLKVMNHSRLFWKNVSAVLPDYRERRLKLNNFARNLPAWD